MTDPQVRLSRMMKSPVWSRLLSRQVQVALDISVLAGSFVAAYLLRYEFDVSHQVLNLLIVQLPLAVLIQLAALHLTGAYSFLWRYIGLAEVKTFTYAAWWSFVVLLAARLGLPEALQHWRVPLSVIVMDTVLGFGGVLTLRVLRRILWERYEREQHAAMAGPLKPVLLVGAGRAGVMAVREILGRGDMKLDVKGFVDDDEGKLGLTVQGVQVLGRTADIPRLVAELGVDHVIITIAQASRKDLRRIVELCESVPIRVRIIPGLFEILGGKVEVSRIRDVEIEDLLGREAVKLDEDALTSFLRGSTVMVTGAGGSIGSELARQVARAGAGRLLLVERAEFALFDIDRELKELCPDQEIVSLVADVSDAPRMSSIFADYRPSVVLHAAAHKHVPLMESNAAEAVKNNILATRLLGELAGEHNVGAFIQISTDKAVRPTSVMGASKRVAELAIQDLNGTYPTRYISVRFGNVLGSAGSVVPIFREQILKGGPVTVTHPDMVRYFMTIPEAAQLVLQAGAMGEGGEIFILDMGEPVRILDMARDMIGLFGLKPYEDVDIVFSGVRPGEKLFEELEWPEEGIRNTRHSKIFIGKIATYPQQRVFEGLRRFRELALNGHERDLRRYFNEFLPEAQVAEEQQGDRGEDLRPTGREGKGPGVAA